MTFENEKSVIGACLLDEHGLHTSLGMLKPYHFATESFSKLFELMRDMAEKNEPVDAVTIATKNLSLLPIVSECQDFVPTTANVSHYAKNVIKAYQLRRLQDLAVIITEGEENDPEKMIEQVDVALLKIATTSENKYSHIKNAVQSATKALDQKGMLGIPTKWDRIDRNLSGLCPGSLYCIAGRPGMGKTALATCMALNVAKQGKAVAFFTLEMTQEEMSTRMICAEGRINITKARNRSLDNVDIGNWMSAAMDVSAMPIYVDDNSSLSMAKLKAQARVMKRKHNIRLLVVDYLQLMSGTGDSRQQEIGSISRGLKVLAKELGIPVVMLSQLNRGLESRTDKRPMLADLRESGDIEQDCDVVIMVYRESEYNDDADPEVAEWIIRKNRSGMQGVIKARWIGQYCHYSEEVSDQMKGYDP